MINKVFRRRWCAYTVAHLYTASFECIYRQAIKTMNANGKAIGYKKPKKLLRSPRKHEASKEIRFRDVCHTGIHLTLNNSNIADDSFSETMCTSFAFFFSMKDWVHFRRLRRLGRTQCVCRFYGKYYNVACSVRGLSDL